MSVNACKFFPHSFTGKMSERQTKAGNLKNLQTCTLSFHSLWTCWKTFVFMSMLKSHYHILSLSHSINVSFTNSRHAEQLLFSCLCSKLTVTLSHSHYLTLSHSTPAPSRILECVLMCVFTLPACEKNFEHSLQANGFSPEWVLMCNFKPLASEKHFEHCL